MIEIRGTDGVKDVVTSTGRSGNPYTEIYLLDGIKCTTFSESVIAVAKKALLDESPFSFIGYIKANEWQGKTYPNLIIDFAWIPKETSEARHKATVEAVKAKPEEEEDLPF